MNIVVGIFSGAVILAIYLLFVVGRKIAWKRRNEMLALANRLPWRHKTPWDDYRGSVLRDVLIRAKIITDQYYHTQAQEFRPKAFKLFDLEQLGLAVGSWIHNSGIPKKADSHEIQDNIDELTATFQKRNCDNLAASIYEAKLDEDSYKIFIEAAGRRHKEVPELIEKALRKFPIERKQSISQERQEAHQDKIIGRGLQSCFSVISIKEKLKLFREWFYYKFIWSDPESFEEP